jgi:hypothetical protein
MTNIANVHTLSIGSVDLIAACIFFLHGELVKLTGDVVCGTGIAIPVGVHAIGRSVGALLLLFFFVVGVAMPTFPSSMPRLVTELARDLVTVTIPAASSATAACIVAAASAASFPAATASSATATIVLATTSAASTLASFSAARSRVDDASTDCAISEEVDVVVIGDNLSVQIGGGEDVGAIYHDGGEEGIVRVVEAGKEILNKFLLVDRPACRRKFVGVALHLGEELGRGHILLPRPSEGDAEVRDPRP